MDVTSESFNFSIYNMTAYVAAEQPTTVEVQLLHSPRHVTAIVQTSSIGPIKRANAHGCLRNRAPSMLTQNEKCR